MGLQCYTVVGLFYTVVGLFYTERTTEHGVTVFGILLYEHIRNTLGTHTLGTH